MPEGVVQWFDQAAGEGRILHAGRRYKVLAQDMESAARVPGGRVHFDIDRKVDDRQALNVQLRSGTRVSRRQRRFGDLSGSPRPDARGTAPFTHEQPELGRDLQRHPMRVARGWATSLADGDLDQAMLLYAPDAVLHVEGAVLIGPAAIRSHWAASPLLGDPAPSSIGGEDGTIVVRWDPPEPNAAPMESHLRVTHAKIAEQWLGAVWTIVAVEAGPAPVALSTGGEVSDRDRSYAAEKIGKVLDTIEDPVLHTSLRLQLARDPARERPALARVTIDLNGEPVRAHTAAPTMTEAIHLLEARLRHRLEHLAEHQQALRRRGPATPLGEWRHGDQRTERPPYFPRPREERRVVRHKTFSTAEATVDEAIFDLEALDYDFFLFTDLASGQDALAHRRTGGSYLLQYLHGPDDDTSLSAAAAVDIDQRPAPRLSFGQAREHLDIEHEPCVFFQDADSGRGHVLYRRYDGHYGLITPVDEALEEQP